MRGIPVQLKHDCIGNGEVIVLDKQQGTKMRRAKRLGTGVRLKFINDEMIQNNVMHGSGFKDLMKKAKKTMFKIGAVAEKSGNAIGKFAKSKSGKALLKGVTKVAVPAILGAISDSSGVDVNGLAPSITEVTNDQISGMGIGKTERKIIRGFNKTGTAITKFAKSKSGKTLLNGIASVAIPATLGVVSAYTGAPVAALAPSLTQAAKKGIDGMGIRKGRKRGGALVAGALVPAGY